MSGGFEVDFIGLALVFLAAFIGAIVSHRLRQSMIVGYIVLGVLLGLVAIEFSGQVGEHIFLDSDVHTWLEKDIELEERVLQPPLELLSDLGLTFLLFFIGLEFSVAKLKRAGKPSLVIALSHLSFNLFAGAMIGMTFGWDCKSTFFLAATLSMSSLGVAAKSLIELKRLDREETEYMLGSMIVEDFMTMVLLTLAMGTIAAEVGTGERPGGALFESVKGALIVYSVFIVLALWLMPYLSRYIEKVKNDEVFTLLALACVLGSAALAYFYDLPFMIGAFFIGMAFSETRISDRLQLRLLSFRDAFVAIFFVAFGLQIAINSLFMAIGPIILGIAFVLINEMFLVGSVGYLLGFNSRGSASLGASLLGRGGDSILFASIGGSLENADGTKLLDKADQLYPFSGGLSLVTNFMVPVMIRKSVPFAVGLGRRLPKWFVFTGAAIGQAMRPTIMEKGGLGEKASPALMVLPVALVGAYLVSAYGALIGNDLMVLGGAVAGLAILLMLYVPLKDVMVDSLARADFSAVGLRVMRLEAVASYAPKGVTLLLAIPAAVTTVWSFVWWLAPVAALAIVAVVAVLGWLSYRSAVMRGSEPVAKRHIDHHLKEQKARMRARYRKK